MGTRLYLPAQIDRAGTGPHRDFTTVRRAITSSIRLSISQNDLRAKAGLEVEGQILSESLFRQASSDCLASAGHRRAPRLGEWGRIVCAGGQVDLSQLQE